MGRYRGEDNSSARIQKCLLGISSLTALVGSGSSGAWNGLRENPFQIICGMVFWFFSFPISGTGCPRCPSRRA